MKVWVDEKEWYLSKTLWMNVISLLIAILLAIAGHESIPSQTSELVLMIVAFLNIVLRFVTQQPLKTMQ
jgi:hypothetical protein